MSRHAKFNSGRSGRTSGISKDYRSVAGKFKHKVDASLGELSRSDAAFQRKCEKILRKHFSENNYGGFDPAEIERSKEAFQEVAREIFTPIGGRGKPSVKKLAIFSAITAILIAQGAHQAVESEFTRITAAAFTNVAVTALTTMTAGPIAGAAVGAGFLVSAAEATPSTAPKASAVKKVAKKSPVKPAEKLMGKYDIEEIVMPKSRIFVASPEGGDWAFTLSGLQRLGKFVSPGVEFSDSQFSLIKNSDLAAAVLDDDFEKFSDLVTKATAETEANFHATLNSFGQSFTRIGTRRLDKSGMIRELARNLQKTLDLDLAIVQEAVQNAFDEHFKTNADLGNEALHSKLRENLQDRIFSRFKGEEAIRKMFESLKKDPALKKDDAAYSAAIAEYDRAQRAAARIEIYDDRLLKARIFTADKESEVITVYKPPISHPFVGYTPYHQRKVLVIVPSKIGEGDRVFFHEALHGFDMETCSLEPDGRISHISEVVKKAKYGISRIEPCGDGKVKDLALNLKLLNAYRRDMERMERVAERGRDSEDMRLDVVNQAGPRFAVVNNGGDIKTMEIIPYATDVFGPKTFLYCMPNVAIARTDFIIKTPEAEFYAAMLRADLKRVKEIVGKNPAILEETYDTVPLHQIAQVLVDAKFDKYVDSKMKTEPKTRYSTVNDFVQKQYEEYKATKKSASVTIDAGGGIGR